MNHGFGINIDDVFAEAEEFIMSFQKPTVPKAVPTELDMLTCVSCGYIGMDETDGFVYCISCGISKACQIDGGAEWRNYAFGDSSKPDTSRCGMPTNPLLPNSSMSTVLVGGGNSYLKKLHKWSTMNNKEAAKFKILMHLHNNASRLGVPSAIINQAQTYAVQICDKMTEDDNIVRGKNRRGLVSACLHFAFKKVDCPRSNAEVAAILGIPESCVVYGVKHFSAMFADRCIVVNDTPTTSSHLAPRYCSQIGMSENLTDLVSQAVIKMEQSKCLNDHVVEAQTGACIWYVVKTLKLKNFTKKQVSETCKISQITVAKCCNKLEAAFSGEMSNQRGKLTK